MEIGKAYLYDGHKFTIIGTGEVKNYGKVTVVEREDGIKCNLLTETVEQRLKAFHDSHSKLTRKKGYSVQFKGNHVFWEFIRYLSQHGRVGGFQAVADKVDQLKMDYFNATGEDLKDGDYNADLSPETWGNAMRVSFPEPDNMSMDEINKLLPNDVEAKRFGSSTEIVISRMPFVLELLSLGFRHGSKHNVQEIEKMIEKYSIENVK